MKAVIIEKYGTPDVLKIKEVDKPIPKPDEILVRVCAVSVTAGDCKMRSLDFGLGFMMNVIIWLPMRMYLGFFKPGREIPGMELSGVVEAVGTGVTLFREGDTIMATTTELKSGSYAEYVCIPEKWKGGVVVKKPDNLDLIDAAAVPIGAMTALHLLKKGKIDKGQKVLIYGASGSVGSYAVQIAKYFNTEVTGVCSTKNIEMVKSLGADKVIDYSKTNITALEEKYDLVFDAVGKISKTVGKKILKPKGNYRHIMEITNESTDDLLFINKLIESGHIKPFIDKRYKLDNISQAHEYVEKGHKRGNVVVTIE